MQIKTTAIVFTADTFHSNRTNQDYHSMGMLLEGAATKFFVGDKVWAEVVKQPWFNAVCASHEPTKVEVDLEIKFDEKGAKVYLNGVSTPKGK